MPVSYFKLYLCRQMIFIYSCSGPLGDTHDYHMMMGERIREKMEQQQHLDEEDHDWIRSMGFEVHQVKHEATTEVNIPPGDSLHIALMIPFLDQYPISSAHYIAMLEWITRYSSVKIHFHVITNKESGEYVDQIMHKVRRCILELHI